MKPKTEYALMTAVVAGGALLAWFAYGRTWQLEPSCATSFVPRCGQSTSGADLEPAGAALALITALASLAVIPTRAKARQVVGVLILLMGLVAVAVAVAARSLSPSMWWVLAAIGSSIAVVGSIVIIRRAPSWPTMSSRYERSDAEYTDSGVGTGPDPGATRATRSEMKVELGVKEAWDALERGVDPTVDPSLDRTGDPQSAERTDSERRPDPGGLAETGLSE